MKGIKKALEILTADNARTLFRKTMGPSFLQIKSTPSLLQDGAHAAAANAYNILKVQVRKEHSIRLAAMAAQVRTAKVGHFGEVIASIDKLTQTLKDESASDKEKKKQCV